MMNNTCNNPLPPELNFVDYLLTLDNLTERHKVRLEKYKPSDVREKLKNYYKIISVRHPFERLVSLYKDKLNRDR